MTRTPLTARLSWKALQAHQEKVREVHLRTLFADDATVEDPVGSPPA